MGEPGTEIKGCLIVGIFLTLLVGILILRTPQKIFITTTANRERVQLIGFVHAVRGFETEYSSRDAGERTTWDSFRSLWKSETGPLKSEGAMSEALQGAKPSALNPRGVLFFEPRRTRSDAKGNQTIVDSWGQPYLLLLDLDGDRKIPDPEKNNGETVNAAVLVWSGGKDGDPDTWADNIASWK